MSPGYALLRHGIRRGLSSAATLPQLRRYAGTTSTSQDAANLPLAGFRVLDMTRVLAGVSRMTTQEDEANMHSQPYATQMLGDLGYAMNSPV